MTAQLPDQLLQAAAEVRQALGDALDLIAPPPRRPSDIQRGLAIDKSLASRLHRAALADEPLEAVLDGAGVLGLRQALERLETRVATPTSEHVGTSPAQIVHTLRTSIDRFAAISAEFPDGRIGLETVMADKMPEIRKIAERKARRAIYQSHMFLMGFRQDVAYRAFIRVPSKNAPHCADLLYVDACIGMLKLREGVTAFFNGILSVGPNESPTARVTTLEGEPATSPTDYLLPQRCSITPEHMAITHRGTQTIYAMRPDHPVLGEPVTVVLAHTIREGTFRYARPERPFEHHHVIIRKPVRVLVWDELCDPALGSGPPEITASFASGPGAIPTRPDLDSVYPVHLEESFESLGVGLSRLASSDVPNCPSIIQQVLARAGIDGNRLSVHRMRIELPVAHTRYIVWHRLIEPNTPTDQ